MLEKCKIYFQIVGHYLLLADDSVSGFASSADWSPRLHPYQQTAANVLFFTFINPSTMAIPPAFANLARTRGTGAPGAVPATTSIIFAVGKNRNKF